MCKVTKLHTALVKTRTTFRKSMHKSVTSDRTRIKEKRKKGNGFLPREYYEMNYICRTCNTESLKIFNFCK